MAKAIRLSMKDRLAMFRCAMYTAMGVKNDEKKPTDRQCLEWFSRVRIQAEHLTDPPITLVPSQPISVKTSSPFVPEVAVLKWSAVINLPEWRDLPM